MVTEKQYSYSHHQHCLVELAVGRVSAATFEIASKTKFCYSQSDRVETGHESETIENDAHVSDRLFVSR